MIINGQTTARFHTQALTDLFRISWKHSVIEEPVRGRHITFSKFALRNLTIALELC